MTGSRRLACVWKDSKDLLGRLQHAVVEAQAAAYVNRHRRCSACRLRGKGQYPIVFRTAFGHVPLASPRLALSRELGRRAKTLNYGAFSGSSDRSVPIRHGLRPEGAQSAAGDQRTLEIEGVVGGGGTRPRLASSSASCSGSTASRPPG